MMLLRELLIVAHIVLRVTVTAYSISPEVAFSQNAAFTIHTELRSGELSECLH